MGKTISGMLIVAAVIHLLPLAGMVSADRLTALYGLPFQEPNLLIMMRHRAVLSLDDGTAISLVVETYTDQALFGPDKP